MASVQGASQLQARLHAMGNATPQMMNTLGLMIVREAKLVVHRKTGNLGRSIRVVEHSRTRVVVAATANYAAFVERGTRPHEITPNVARVLAWGGARRLSGSLRSGASPTNFAMRVHHPGSRPYPFLMPAAVAVAKKNLLTVEPIITAWNSAA